MGKFLTIQELKERKNSTGRTLDKDGAIGRNQPRVENFELLRRIAKSRRRQEVYLQTIGDSVLLAAQQVQDKRLELLEQEPEITGTEVFFDIMLAVVFSSAVSGKLLKSFAKKLLDPIARTPLAFKILPKTERGLKFFNEIAGSQLGKVGTKEVTKEFLEKADLSGLYKNVVFEVAETAANSIRQIPKKFQKTVEQAPLIVGDSAGVGIMNLVQIFVRDKIASINLSHDYLKIAVQEGVMDDDATNELLQFLDGNIKETIKEENYSLGAIKGKFMLFYESCIWLMLIEPTYGKEISGNFVRIVDGTGKDVDERLIKYWVNRFFHPESEFESFKQYADRVVSVKTNTMPRAKQELANFFEKLSKEIKGVKESVESAAREGGQGFALLKPATSKH